MRRTTFLVAPLTVIISMAFTAPIKAQDSPIAGAWITTSWEGQEGDPQPGLLIFTETHYSMMFVPAGMTREQWTGEAMTEADMVAAFSTLVANSGRYTWSEAQITTEAYVSLNPNYMASWGENHLTYTFRIEGDTLHLSWPDEFMGPETPGISGTFRRVG